MSPNQPKTTLAVWVVIVSLVCVSPCASQAEPTFTPTQVVFQWLQWYPKELPRAATLTTTSLRNGLSQTQWVEKHSTLLKDLHFKYLDGKILEEESEEISATVTVKVRLFVVIGEVVQVERYTLKKLEGHWLIDDQEIEEDRVIGRSI